MCNLKYKHRKRLPGNLKDWGCIMCNYDVVVFQNRKTMATREIPIEGKKRELKTPPPTPEQVSYILARGLRGDRDIYGKAETGKTYKITETANCKSWKGSGRLFGAG